MHRHIRWHIALPPRCRCLHRVLNRRCGLGLCIHSIVLYLKHLRDAAPRSGAARTRHSHGIACHRARHRQSIQGCGEISPPQRWALQADARAAASCARRRDAAPWSAAPAHAATQSAPLRPSRARASLCALASVQTQQQGRLCRLRRRSPPPRRSLHRAPIRSRAVRGASSTCSRRSAPTGSVTREHSSESAAAAHNIVLLIE